MIWSRFHTQTYAGCAVLYGMGSASYPCMNRNLLWLVRENRSSIQCQSTTLELFERRLMNDKELSHTERFCVVLYQQTESIIHVFVGRHASLIGTGIL